MNTQISTATNIQAPDLSGSQNNASQYFNNFFALDFSVGAANDAITAYFEKYTSNPNSGKALAAAVLYTAKAQNLDPMTVLSEFQQLTPNQLNNYLAAFLNFNRVPTSIIGIKTVTTTNEFIKRLVLL